LTQNKNFNSETALIDLFEIWQAIWLYKFQIIIFTVLTSILSVVYALNLPNQYKAEVLISHANQDNGSSLASMAGQLGGLAGLAGINIAGDSNEAMINVERLQSKTFLFEFIHHHGIKVPLMAGLSWDKESKQLLLDESKYNDTSKVWLSSDDEVRDPEPTDMETYLAFINILKIEQNKINGLIEISLEYLDPYLAKEWLMLLINELNEKRRDIEILEKQRSIEFLKKQLAKTNVAEMKNVFYQIIEEQTKSMLLAEVQEDFVFKIIDAAIVPEKKSSPKRAVICIIGTMLGAILSVIFSLFVFYVKKYRVGLKSQLSND